MLRVLALACLLSTFTASCTTSVSGTAAVVETSEHVRGNRNSMIYHWRGCPNYDDIAPKNRVDFTSPTAAEAAGYRPARNCDTPPPR